MTEGDVREICKGLLGDDNDLQSRYIKGLYNDNIVVVCLYLPDGNLALDPKLDYKLAWFKKLQKRAAELLKFDVPVILTGDFNVMPTEFDVYNPERWVDDALFRSEIRMEFKKLIDSGWTDAIRSLYPSEIIYTFWDYFRNAYKRNAGLRVDHFLLNSIAGPKLIFGGVNKEVRIWEKTSDHAPVWITSELD